MNRIGTVPEVNIIIKKTLQFSKYKSKYKKNWYTADIELEMKSNILSLLHALHQSEIIVQFSLKKLHGLRSKHI